MKDSIYVLADVDEEKYVYYVEPKEFLAGSEEAKIAKRNYSNLVMTSINNGYSIEKITKENDEPSHHL